jgi:hypothetical protein
MPEGADFSKDLDKRIDLIRKYISPWLAKAIEKSSVDLPAKQVIVRALLKEYEEREKAGAYHYKGWYSDLLTEESSTEAKKQ